ncbi:hypothetical protein TanjilG_21012 [Lupinus angustifolius]|uniref:Cystatin domain-containing protein n=1 Tax=Lupinus angustifolius TaxID=3871 RepID=A0A1J7I1S6_LUPAN|nr:PREDICTED: cysteine proteinase inhibitor 4 [Lupinus angustifolius]OIW19156.1 hypothetical protein TanjilG_21012 [Lupinus angustifolius]
MAALIRSPAVILTLLVTLLCLLCTASYGRLVGGRKEVANVQSNEEVQELGRFSVEEYNRSLKLRAAEEEVKFMEVVEAEEQVVSGIKYYLKILTLQNGASRMFESVVVVKPWLKSKQLLNFAPSSQ